MMEEVFADYLSEGVGVQAIAGDRIDWNIRPQAENTPSISLHTISSIPNYTDEGFAGLTFSRVQIDCWAKTYAQAKDLSRAVTTRLGGDGNAKFTHGGIEFQVSMKEDEQDSFERAAGAEDLHRVRLDFALLYK